MLDWVSATIPGKHVPLEAGRVVGIHPSGDIDWDVPKAMQVRGSHDASIQLRSSGTINKDGTCTELYFSGNPSKFLQGHNVHGSSDLISLVTHSLLHAQAHLSHDLSEVIGYARGGHFSVKRLDVARSYRFADSRTVDAALNGLCHLARSRSGRASSYGSTVYLQKGSRRWSFKLYNKFCDPTTKKLSDELLDAGLYEYTNGLLRAELTIRSMELKEKGIQSAKALQGNIEALFDEYFERIDIAMNTNVTSEEIQSMPRAIRNTYLMWQNGVDVRPTLSKASFYRHRSQLLPYRVDIAMPPAAGGEVIPMFVTAKGEPEQCPQDFHDRGIIFDAKRTFKHAG